MFAAIHAIIRYYSLYDGDNREKLFEAYAEDVSAVSLSLSSPFTLYVSSLLISNLLYISLYSPTLSPSPSTLCLSSSTLVRTSILYPRLSSVSLSLEPAHQGNSDSLSLFIICTCIFPNTLGRSPEQAIGYIYSVRAPFPCVRNFIITGITPWINTCLSVTTLPE